MPYTFAQAKKAFQEDRIQELANDPSGLRFLKLRSLSRPEYLRKLVNEFGIKADDLSGDRLLCSCFESSITIQQIETTIKAIYDEGRRERLSVEDELVSELYKLNAFDWGGLHQNSLEKTIVNNYVKKIKSFDRISECVENEIHHSTKSYVMCSWYNHWTSIIIEDLFRDHPAVLPSVGLIKKIDFFISDIPYDLKVTYLPEGYIKEKRQQDQLRPEITLLKRICRDKSIHFDIELPESRLLEDLWKKVSDHPSSEAKELIADLIQKRTDILNECIENKEGLIRWLYENQGVRRFDSSNRLFLVLVDCRNFFDSWKLKRAKPLLLDRIHKQLEQMRAKAALEINFSWEGAVHKCVSDVIFVIHNE